MRIGTSDATNTDDAMRRIRGAFREYDGVV
jgi:hypothetical protein